MRKVLAMLTLSLFVAGCGGGGDKKAASNDPAGSKTTPVKVEAGMKLVKLELPGMT